ncbi:S1 family peptidase [Flexivirga sp. B27]
MKVLRRTALATAILSCAGFASVAPASAQTAPEPATQTTSQSTTVASDSLAGTIALDNCSGSLVRYAQSEGGDKALMLTNGHCYEGGMPEAGEVITDQPSSRTGKLLNTAGDPVGTVTADTLLYSTMTGTDVSLYQLDATYDEITADTDIEPLTLASSKPTDKTAITVASGYWQRTWHCDVNGFVDTLKEADWTMHDSVRYSMPGCDILGGSSGSPVIDDASGEVVAVNNTINEGGEDCTMNNPCEVNEDGTTTATEGEGYAQQTYWITTCLTDDRKLDLSVEGCLLAKPAN